MKISQKIIEKILNDNVFSIELAKRLGNQQQSILGLARRNSRNLTLWEAHLFLEVRRDFSTWIKSRIEEYGFIENQDYSLLPEMGEQTGEQTGRGGHNKIEYALTLDMAKELFELIRDNLLKI